MKGLSIDEIVNTSVMAKAANTCRDTPKEASDNQDATPFHKK